MTDKPRTGDPASPFRLLPHLVEPLLAAPGHAVCLLPTPGFRLAAFASRGSMWEIAGKTGNPGRALHNLLERDRMFTDRLRRDLQHLGLPAIEIDTAITEDDLARRITEVFGL